MNIRQLLVDQVLVCDGAMGTMLHAAGNSLDQSLPALSLSNPDRVRIIHESYVDAGVDVIQTNTFGANNLRLSEYGLAAKVEEINKAAVRIAQETARVDRPVLVAGSVSPAVSVRQRHRARAPQRVEALREQIEILVCSGVDLIMLETFGYLDELVEAVEVAVGLGDMPVIAQATFTEEGQMLSGHTAYDLCAALSGVPLAALGINCTVGPQHSLTLLRELAEHSRVPLTAQPNAGLPRRLGPAQFEYDIDADYFARYVRELLGAGAAMVGGCCGTTPTQLVTTVDAVAEFRASAMNDKAPTQPNQIEVTAAAIIATSKVGADKQLFVELAPGRTADTDAAVEEAGRLRVAGIGLVLVPAPRGARPQANSVDLALQLRQRVGIDAVATVTTWDRTIMALQADLLGAYALGIRRIICETGIPPLLGDYPQVDGVWDVDSIGLIELLTGLNGGHDCHGLPLPAKTDFEIGARINPGSQDAVAAAIRAQAKVAAGAQFLITRPVYEVSGLHRILDTIGGQVPTLVTVRPLASFAEAEYLAHEVPDVTIPHSTLNALERAGDSAPDVGLELAAEVATHAKAMAAGLVISPGSYPGGALDRLMSLLAS